MRRREDALAQRALEGVAQFQLALALLLFLPAWSLSWWQGWAFWLVFGFGLLAITLWLIRHDQRLLAARMGAGPQAETRPLQKRIQTAAGIVVVAEVVLPGLAHRWGIGQLGPVWVAAGLAGVAVALALLAWIMAVNGSLHAAVRLSEGQEVVSTGPYRWLRHPMYAVSTFLFLVIPIALGTWTALPLAALLAGLMGWRALDEEAMLLSDLPGYEDYAARVRWRMMPGLW